MRIRPALALLLAVLLVVGAPARTEAKGKVYVPGYYLGHTSQGYLISFVVAHHKVSALFAEVADSCSPGKWYVTLTPKHAPPITSGGSWSLRTSGSLPTIYRGRLGGSSASGTIDDTSKNNAGRTCHGHASFRAQRSTPMHLGRATVGTNGTEVLLKLSVPALRLAPPSNEIVPLTRLALLIYGSNARCPGSYRAADALARSAESFGMIGLISDAYVTTDYGFASIKSYKHGVFTFDVNTNSLIRAPSGNSPFSTVCVMLYSGKPATLTPSHNVALARIHGRLVRGPGPPNHQP